MKIGFTGTQQGMTIKQALAFTALIKDKFLGSLAPVSEFHHGDCIGADATAHDIVESLFGDPRAVRLVVHPPENPVKRAWKRGHEILPEKPYLVRNRDIVHGTELLIATPKAMVEEPRGGTWYTIRYARQRGEPIVIVWPDGSTS